MTTRFAVAPADESDIPYLATIQWAALLSNPLIQTLYPHGPTPALTAFTRDSYAKAMTYPSVRLLKATDTARGEIVAFAKWIVYPEEPDEGDNADPFDEKTNGAQLGEKTNGKTSARKSSWIHEEGDVGPPRPDGVNTRALNAWNEVMNRTRRGIMAKRRHACRSKTGLCTLECYFACFAPRLWVLDILHTHPSHQGRGAGAQLVHWGTALADKQRQQCYLEASPAGYPLFRKLDFHDVTEMEIDLNRYREGFYGQYKYKHVIMVRPPDVPPKVPPKDSGRVASAVYVGEGGRGLSVEEAGARSKSEGDQPDAAGVGGWNFGLLDGSAFGGERESNYMERRSTVGSQDTRERNREETEDLNKTAALSSEMIDSRDMIGSHEERKRDTFETFETFDTEDTAKRDTLNTEDMSKRDTMGTEDESKRDTISTEDSNKRDTWESEYVESYRDSLI